MSYVKKEEKYTDYLSTAKIFLPFGLLGMIVVCLNLFGILHWMSSWLQMLVCFILFGIFFYVGCSALLQLKMIRKEMEIEKQMQEMVFAWLNEKGIKQQAKQWILEEEREEARELLLVERLKIMIIENFQEIKEPFAVYLAEEYTECFLHNLE